MTTMSFRKGSLHMSTESSGTAQARKRREDFPVESFRYLEAKLQQVRKVVMNGAAEIADLTDSRPEFYRVEKRHVDHALAEFLGDPDAAMERLGVRKLASKERT